MALSQEHLWSEALLERFGFATPAGYRLLESRKAFLWPKEFPYYTAWVESGERYLWLHDMRWLSVDQLQEFAFQEYQRQEFVPFARTVGGDWWCWYPSSAVAGTVPVVFCPDDCTEADLYAPDFKSALWRHVLEGAAMHLSAEEAAVYQAMLRRYVVDLAVIWTPVQTEEIRRVASLPPAEAAIIPWQEYERLVADSLGEEYLKLGGILWQNPL